MATRLNKIDGGGAHSPARVPPHNLEAEESVLGSCMLSRQAIATALETLTPEDFYKPAHTEMFRIMLDLYARGEPIDAVTMGEELKRQGNLEEFGGKPYLFTLVSSVPSPGSVGHYAKIVVENATLRRLIEASQEIGDLAYALPDDVEQAVDQAEDLIYQVMNRRTSEELAALKDLLTENMELVEKLYERGSAITGVATGFTDLDELTAGLQPSNLIIVAARPSMGKALALDTPIATPTGWVTMGELAPGDEVFDERGRPCTVEAVSPVYTDHDCYEVVFDDGTVLVADAGHQWVAWDEAAISTAPLVPGGTPWARVVTTAEMVAEGVRTGTDADTRPRWSIRLTDPLDLPESDLPADPYVLGSWLGDQYSGNAEVTLSGRDRAHFSTEFEGAGYCLGLHAQQACFVLGTSPVRATGAWQGTEGPGRALSAELEDLGLGRGAGRAAVEALPEDYLWGSFKQRLALLQGLMDAAGTACDAGTVALWLTSRDLIAQVRDLACSLGHCPGPITAVAPSATRRGYCLTWAPLDPVFRMERKATQLGQIEPADGTEVRRAIVAVRPVPPVPVRCIQVDSPSHLYLAGDSLIPTHNSALALSIAQHVAATDHVPVVIFSLEMSKMELVQRLMCSEARVDSNRLRKGALQDSDWPKLSLALGRLAEAPIFIDDTPNATIMEMRAKCRRVKSKSGLGLVIIDYLQLMAPLKRTDNRVQEVSEISRSLKILARELDVPVIALSQLSRNVEYRADKRPLLADLRESGSIEQDADVVMFIYRDEVYNADSPQRGIAELHISKHRSGPIGKVELTFLSHYTKFANLARGM